MPSAVLRLCCAFFSQKGTGFLISFREQQELNGKTMSNLENSSKNYMLCQTAIRLFTTYGFHTAGVDLISKEAKYRKAPFITTFARKSTLLKVHCCFQKSKLKEEVLAIIYSSRYRTSKDKLKEIVVLHANFNSLYYLLLKAYFELKSLTHRLTVWQ